MEKECGNSATLPKREKINYGLFFFGQNMIYFLQYMFLATYLLMQGLQPVATAGILLAVKIWDAVNDCLFGGIADKVKFKRGGKFLPWLKIATPIIGVTTVMLFAIPSNIGVTFKLIWFAVAYILWDAAYTMCDVPIFGAVSTMTEIQSERTSLMTTGRIFANVGVLLAMGIGYVLPSKEVGLSFTWVAVIITVIAMATMSIFSYTGKERFDCADTNEKSYSLKQMFSYLGKNKYLLIFFLGIIFIQGLNTASAVLMFACYYFFNSALIATVISVLTFIPAVIVAFCMPVILRKVDKYVFFMWSNVAYAVLSIVSYFIGPILIPHIIVSVLRGFALGGFTVVQFMFTPDCAEYGQYKSGVDAKGITFAIQTFTQKLVSAIATALGVAVLGWFGWQTVNAKDFAELAEQGVVQSSSALTGLWISYALIPAVGAVIAVLIWLGYKLKTSDVELMAKCNNGEITREECDSQLSKKY